MLMLAASSVRIMRKAIVTFSLIAVGHPSCGRRLNLGFDSTGLWPPLVVLFGASISRGKTLLPEWKGSPLALLSTWYGKKGIEESLRTPAHWLNLHFGDFRFYFTWYCTFMSAITFKLMSANYISGCSGWTFLWETVFSSVYSSSSRIAYISSWSFVVAVSLWFTALTLNIKMNHQTCHTHI
jgi:hypothetical protein